MEGSEPLVSIGMPVYNEERYLTQALDSLLAQEYKNFELIISDNASQDATQEICLEYAARDSRIHYHRSETNLGAIKNFNRVFALSKGEYFMWAGGHDRWAPEFIRRCMEGLQQDQDVVLCYPQIAVMGPNGEKLPWLKTFFFDTRCFRGKLSRFMTVVWASPPAYILHGLIRSSALKQTSIFRMTWNADVLLLAELSLLGEFAQVPAVLFYPRHFRGAQTRDEIYRRLSRQLFVSHGRVLLPSLRNALELALLPFRVNVIDWKAKLLLLWCIVPLCIAIMGPGMVYDVKRLIKNVIKWR
jgi:glycosyltransferase involved in cell wall biosynthesis